MAKEKPAARAIARGGESAATPRWAPLTLCPPMTTRQANLGALRSPFLFDCGANLAREFRSNLLKPVSVLRVLGRPGHHFRFIFTLNDGFAAWHEITASQFFGHIVSLLWKSYAYLVSLQAIESGPVSDPLPGDFDRAPKGRAFSDEPAGEKSHRGKIQRNRRQD